MATRAAMLVVFSFVLTLSLALADSIADNKPPHIYISNLTNIIKVPLNETTGTKRENGKPQVILKTDGHIRSLGIDPLNERLYYGDFWYHTINSSDFHGGNQRTLLMYAVGYAQGISVDYTSDNVYWTDSLMDFIEVTDFNGRHRKVLFKLEDHAEPRGIVVNHVTGQLFWTDWGKYSKIERSTLSGNDRVTIVSDDLKWPNDLAIDYDLKRLLWVDAHHDFLSSCDYNGDDRKLHYELVFNNGLVHPYSLAYSATHKVSYFSDWYSDKVYAASHMDGQNVSVVFSNKGDLRNLGQIRLSEKNQLLASKVCTNHSCSHMCFNSGANKHTCGCPTGMELSADNVNCQAVHREYEMYFVDSVADTVLHLIKYKSQDGFSIRELPQPLGENLHTPIALDFDPVSRYVYWSDVGAQKLYRMHENGGKTETLLTGHTTFGLAVDHINQLLYWFEDDTNLVVSSFDGKNRKTLMRNLASPRDIALYEKKGYVFFNDFKYGRIYRINADGTDLKYLATREKILVTGIAVDKIDDRIYWCDRDTYSVEYTDLDFNHRHKIIQKTTYWAGKFYLINNEGSVVKPFDITVLGDRIFWSDTYKRAIFSADKNSGGRIEYVSGGLDHPRDVHVFNDEVRPEYKTLNLVTHLQIQDSPLRALCYKTCPTEFPNDGFPDPEPCPSGYEETRFNYTCSNCSDALGGNFKCQCMDWMTCAQRGSGDIFGCHPVKSMMLFKVRECKQVVNPGHCPYDTNHICYDKFNTTETCVSDNDCNDGKKCCKDACGTQLCQSSVQNSDHPCTKNNGGCSHFCVVGPKNSRPTCLCPDNMTLDTDTKTCKLNKGVCPKMDDTFSTCEIKNDSCLTDKDCSKDYLCCSKGCGKTCIKPVEPSCLSPKEVGPCFTKTARWYFNKDTKKCEMFYFGGCGGNRNNFKSQSGCREMCMPNDPRSRCFQPKVVGNCKAAIQSYYYDAQSKKCRLFYYGGCNGNQNRFKTNAECNSFCDPRSRCFQPKVVGNCEAAIQSYYYDAQSKKCRLFYYGGCNGNQNRFKTNAECNSFCVHDQSTTTTTTTKQPIVTSTPLTTVEKAETTTTTTAESISITTTTKQTTTTQGNPTTTTTRPPTTGPPLTNAPSTLVPEKPTTTRPQEATTIRPEEVTTIRPEEKTTITTTSEITSSTSAPQQKCPQYYAGRSCEYNVERGTIKIVLKTSRVISQKEFSQSISKSFTSFCESNECNSLKPGARKRRQSPLPQKISEKDVIIFQYEQSKTELRVTFAVLLRDKDGNLVMMNTDDIQQAATAVNLFQGQSGKAEFEPLVNDATVGDSEGRSKKNKRVNVVVGIIIALIVLVVLGVTVWYMKRRRFFEKTPPAPGAVTFENRLYEDLHSNNKVQLPNGGDDNVAEQSHYATPNASALTEYASAMPPISTLGDYAEVAAAPNFILPSYEQIGAASRNEKSKDWVQFDQAEENKKEKDWVQFENKIVDEELKKVAISDFVEPNYTDPYDFDAANSPTHSTPPMTHQYTPNSAYQLEISHSVSLGDLKGVDEKTLPGVEGGLNETSPRKIVTADVNVEYENTTIQDQDATQRIDVQVPPASEC